MFITQNGLKKVFALSAVSLYAFGLSCSCIEAKHDYVRYLENEVSKIRLIYDDNNDNQDYVSLKLCTYQNNQGFKHFDDVGEQVDFNCYIIGFFDIKVDYIYKTLSGNLKVGIYDLSEVHADRQKIYYDYSCEYAYISRNIPLTFDITRLDTDNNPYSYNLYNDILNPDKTPVDELMQFGFYMDFDYICLSSSSYVDISAYWCYGNMYQYMAQTSNEINLATYRWDFGQDYQLNYLQDYNLSTRDFDRTMSFDSVSLSNYVVSYSWNVGGYQSGYTDATNYILTHPSQFNLYTYQEYLAYGNLRYNEGLDDANGALSFSGLINEIFKAPVTMFYQVFTNNQAWQWRLPNGEVLDIGGLMTFILTIGIALAIVRLIMKIGGK